MAIKWSPTTTMPNWSQWLLIIGFIAGAILLIPQYVSLTEAQIGYISLIAAVLALFLKVFTTPEQTP